MLCKRHITRWCMLALLLTVAAPAWARPGLVRTVRCSSTDQSARVVIDLSRPLGYDVALTADSSALVVEIPGAVSETSLGEVKVGKSGIASVSTRTVQSPDSRVQVTLRLDAPVAWKHFALPASNGKPARIVVDVNRAATAAPVVASNDLEPADSDATAPESTSRSLSAYNSDPAINRPFVVAID